MKISHFLLLELDFSFIIKIIIPIMVISLINCLMSTIYRTLNSIYLIKWPELSFITQEQLLKSLNLLRCIIFTNIEEFRDKARLDLYIL